MTARTLTLLAILAAAAAAIFFFLSPSSEDGEKTRLTLTGSSTIAPLALEIAKRYEEQNGNVRIDVETGGSSRGMADARKGLADIGMVSRSLKADEADLTGHLLARDGVGIIVHASNPIEAITGAEVVSIYKREITSWETLGGPNAGIVLIHKAEGRSTLEVFLDHFKLDNPSIKPDVIVGDNEQGIKNRRGQSPWYRLRFHRHGGSGNRKRRGDQARQTRRGRSQHGDGGRRLLPDGPRAEPRHAWRDIGKGRCLPCLRAIRRGGRSH
jgi:ABC-type phosphate transport system substrate-binding protein